MRLLGVLLIVGSVAVYFWWILTAVVVVAAVVSCRRWWDAECERRSLIEAQRRALLARADQQHAWALAGDPRGTYGQ